MTGNRAIKHWTLLLLSCCILLPSLLRAEEARGRESILIISSYNPDTRRMSSFITEFERQVVASGVPCDIYVETLECKSINDAPLWISQTDNLITRYESKGGLRAIVLLGQEAWASFVSLGRIPKEVMCFSCFVSSNGIVLPPPADSTGVWMPPSINYMNMVDSLHNVGGLLNKYDVRRNIELIRTLYTQLSESDYFKDYMLREERSFADDRKLLEDFFKELQSCEALETELEEMSILWSDDLPYIVMMILRSLSGLKPSHTELKVPSKFKSDEDPEFVKTLFEKSLVNYDAYQDYIEKFTANWDVERIVFMDNLIIGTAMAELTSFPSIPVKVTLDEYIEISKYYSTPGSSTFINGVLDKIVESLTAEGRIRKAGRGLI